MGTRGKSEDARRKDRPEKDEPEDRGEEVARHIRESRRDGEPEIGRSRPGEPSAGSEGPGGSS